MGGSSYSDDLYHSRAAHRAATSTPTFTHDHDIKTGKVVASVHAKLNPKGVTRESRDSDAHPNSLPISVLLDVTGSMSTLPRVIQAKIPQLMGLLIRKGYVADPQVMFAAVGDYHSDDAQWARIVVVTSSGWLKQQVRGGASLLFEGAQGVLLDEHHGWAPNYTWSTCTPDNARALATEAGIAFDELEVIGVLRAHLTRHGAGPFPTETDTTGWHDHNQRNQWQGRFRWGTFDARLARYAIECSGKVDRLAITHLDCIPFDNRFLYCTGYRDQPSTGKPRLDGAIPLIETMPITDSWRSMLSAVITALPNNAPPVSIASFGPTSDLKELQL